MINFVANQLDIEHYNLEIVKTKSSLNERLRKTSLFMIEKVK